MSRPEHCNLLDCYQDQKMVVGVLSLDSGHSSSKRVEINRQPQDPNLDFLGFSRGIMDIYLKKYVCRNQSGRPRGRIFSVRPRVTDEIRLDRTDHVSTSFVTQKGCGLCGKSTRKGCSRCNLGIQESLLQRMAWYSID